MGQTAFKISKGGGKREQVILFETEEGGSTSPKPAAAVSLGRTAKNLEPELSVVADVARLALATFRKLSPASGKIEFGVEFGGAVGIPLVTQGTAKANFKVTLEWHEE